MRLVRLLLCTLIVSIAVSTFVYGQARVRHAMVKESRKAEEPRHVDLGVHPSDRAPKSVTLAVVYSLILPGMGNLYADNFSTGKYYLVAETGLWLTYAGFRSHGQWLRQDARTFAAQHSDAVFNGKDDQFDVNIGNFNSLEDFNEAKLRNRQYDQLYNLSPAYGWRWDNDANRLAYKDTRIRSDEAFRNSQFVIGALVLNRIIAAISAARAVADYNSLAGSAGAWRLDARVLGGTLAAHGIELTLSKEF
ncbi:MAG: hypothetical protein AABZ02_13410 [Bacteroidota bacterium]